MKFFSLIVVLNLLTSNYSAYATSGDAIEEETPLTNVDSSSRILCVNRYYQGVEGTKFSWTEKAEKGASAALSSTGLICMYFLGAEFINNLTGVQPLGYSLGPVFEAPVAVMSYEAQNDLLKEIKKKFNPDWNVIAIKPSTLKKFIKGGTYTLVGALGGVMSTVAIYYVNYYLEPLIGEGFWVFIPEATLTYTIMGSLGTLGLINLFKEGLSQTAFQQCQSDQSCKREELKKAVDSLIFKIQNTSEEEVEVHLQQIQQGKLCEMLVENAQPLDEDHPLHHSPCYERGKVGTGFTGAVISIVGAIVMVPATTEASNYVLESWLGVDPSTSKIISKVCGVIGGLTTAGFRGKSSAGTFRILYDKIGSWYSNRNEPLDAYSKVKTGMIEGGTWIVSAAGIAPKVQFILNSMEKSLLENAVLGCSVVATITSDYFAWKRVPPIVKDLFVPKTARDRTLAVLNDFKQDIDQLSDDVVDAVYGSLNNQEVELERQF